MKHWAWSLGFLDGEKGHTPFFPYIQHNWNTLLGKNYLEGHCAGYAKYVRSNMQEPCQYSATSGKSPLDIAPASAHIVKHRIGATAAFDGIATPTMEDRPMHNDPNTVPQARREAIVGRDGGTTRVILAEIKNTAELAFALRFVVDHYTYKRSKIAGVTPDTVSQVADGFDGAFGSYAEEVALPNDIQIEGVEVDAGFGQKPISRLGEGKVENPYTTLKA